MYADLMPSGAGRGEADGVSYSGKEALTFGKPPVVLPPAVRGVRGCVELLVREPPSSRVCLYQDQALWGLGRCLEYWGPRDNIEVGNVRNRRGPRTQSAGLIPSW